MSGYKSNRQTGYVSYRDTLYQSYKSKPRSKKRDKKDCHRTITYIEPYYDNSCTYLAAGVLIGLLF